MILFATLLASSTPLPWLDRSWIDRKARLETIAAESGRKVGPARAVPASVLQTPKRLPASREQQPWGL
jgi:hypothetical protein